MFFSEVQQVENLSWKLLSLKELFIVLTQLLAVLSYLQTRRNQEPRKYGELSTIVNDWNQLAIVKSSPS